MAVKHLINEKIKDPKVIVVDEDGKNIGAMLTKDAVLLASSKDLDLVLFVPSSKSGSFPICKIINYGRFSYQQDMKQKIAKKNQVTIKMKEVKVRPQVGAHDLQWKADQANEWLKEGSTVKFKIMTYGRIATKSELIQETYQKFLDLIKDTGKVITDLKQLSPVMYEATIVKK